MYSFNNIEICNFRIPGIREVIHFRHMANKASPSSRSKIRSNEKAMKTISDNDMASNSVDNGIYRFFSSLNVLFINRTLVTT